MIIITTMVGTFNAESAEEENGRLIIYREGKSPFSVDKESVQSVKVCT